MPDIVLKVPHGYRDDELLVQRLQQRLQVAAALHLECLDENNEPLSMHQGEIDVVTGALPYDASVGRAYTIVVMGYAYPDRMRNIGQRLDLILADVFDRDDVPIPQSHIGRRASATFVPLPLGCWASLD